LKLATELLADDALIAFKIHCLLKSNRQERTEPLRQREITLVIQWGSQRLDRFGQRKITLVIQWDSERLDRLIRKRALST
jgi:hypothetical protein